MTFTDTHHLIGMRQRLLFEWMVVVTALVLLSSVLTIWKDLPGIRDINHRAYNLSMQAAPKLPPDPNIVIIAIDDASIEALGYWPWRRAVHAELLKRLHGARAVGLDLIFSGPHPIYPQDDLLLANAIAEQGRVILPEILSPDGWHQTRPIGPLAQAAAALGRVDVQPDPDGTLRAMEPRRTPANGGPPLPHFSLALARVIGQDKAAIAKTLATPPDTARHIRFTDSASRRTIYPYAAVLNGQIPESAFQDRIVLIGAWASGLGDHLPTPLSRTAPGVEILADILQNMQGDLWIRVAPTWITVLAGLGLILPVCLGLRMLSARRGLIGVLIAVVFGLITDALLLQEAGYWLPPAGILLALVLAYPLWSWRSQEATLSHIDAELERLRIPLQSEDTTRDSDTLSNPLGPDTLPERAVRLNRAISRLKQATQTQEETLSFLSHDMRSPQSAILAIIELRRQVPNHSTEETALASIEQQARATLRLVDQFVQQGRAESATLNLHTCYLDDLIQECCDQRWPQAAQRQIELRFEPRHPEAVAHIDRELIGRAIGNLLDNALLYSPTRSVVECSLVPAERYWNIHVQDMGPGIPEGQMEHLFDRFHRLSGGAHKPTGSGLGLAFVKTVTQRHGGRVFCVSPPGQGARFTISLPAED